MTPMRKVFASFVIVGTLMVGGAACSSDSDKSSGESTEAWCKRFEKYEKEEADADIEDTGKAFTALAKDAPAPIKKDMEMLASAFTALDDIDMEDEAAMKELEKKYDEDKIDAATKRIETFMKKECGLDLNEG